MDKERAWYFLHSILSNDSIGRCLCGVSASVKGIPVLALIIPALWIFPQGGVAGLALMAAMTTYGLTLPHQPFTLSVGLWVLFPLLMVAFSKRSSLAVVLTSALIVSTLMVGIMVKLVASLLVNLSLLLFRSPQWS